jgi:hypothetical protein
MEGINVSDLCVAIYMYVLEMHTYNNTMNICGAHLSAK